MSKSIAEVAKDKKREEKDTLLARIVEIKRETEEIKDMVRRIKDKDSEWPPAERVTPRSDLTTSSEEWTDEVIEAVRKGLLW